MTQRIADGRTNTVGNSTARSVWDIIRANVFTRVNAIFGILCATVLATGEFINAVFGLLIVANSAVGIVQELRAKHTLSKLRIISSARPTVIRDGEKVIVDQSDVVQDDLILLTRGDEIVVDGTVVEIINDPLHVDESQLTGESHPVVKQVGDELLSGSLVTSGTVVFRAEEVGEHAYAAKLAKQASAFQLTQSGLMTGINSILKVIVWLLVPTAALTIWTQLTRLEGTLKQSILETTAAIIPMIPEGLILMTSIAFAAGVIRLGKYKTLVNELVAIEGLARVDTACLDKTGTLTTNKMELADVYTPTGQSSPPQIYGMLAHLVGSQHERNDTTEAIQQGLSEKGFEGQWTGREIPFSSHYKFSGFHRDEPGGQQTWILGAPDVLLSESSSAALKARAWEDEGLRVLAFGHSDFDMASVSEETTMESAPKITDPHLVVLRQQVRPDAREALEFFAAQDVDIKIISGDHPDSVTAVVKQATDAELVTIDARCLDGLSDDAFDAEIARGNVFGRVTPEQKRAMIESLHRHNHRVAMTGDGVNDVLALKQADIGVAMGSGAPATRSVAQLVLLTDEFSALPKVVAEGRRVIGNIERVAELFLTKTVYSVLLALVIGIVGISFPFQPIHVTLTGWFTIGIPAFILSLAPNHDRPRDGFVRRVLGLAVPSGVIIGSICLGLWFVIHPADGASQLEYRQAGTTVLVTLIIMCLWVLGIVARPLTRWRIVLLMSCTASYLVIFSVPVLASILILEIGNWALMRLGIIVGCCGAVLIEAAHVVMWRWRRLAMES